MAGSLIGLLILVIVIAFLVGIIGMIPGLDPTVIRIGRAVAILILVIAVIYCLAGFMGVPLNHGAGYGRY